jgi:DNA-binding SARP family transcriptional activator
VTYYSSMSFTLRLFGSPAIELEDGSWQDIANTKPALLLFLAFVGDWVSRGSLATLLQPDGNNENVRRYLRVLLKIFRGLVHSRQRWHSSRCLKCWCNTNLVPRVQ